MAVPAAFYRGSPARRGSAPQARSTAGNRFELAIGGNARMAAPAVAPSIRRPCHRCGAAGTAGGQGLPRAIEPVLWVRMPLPFIPIGPNIGGRETDRRTDLDRECRPKFQLPD